MSAARRAARAGRTLLIALLVGAVIIAAIVVAYVAGRSSGAPSAVPSGRIVTRAATPSESAPTADAAPTGCLGGQSRDGAMVLSAQARAQRSSYGAVELATAFYRWTYRFPVPSPTDIAAIGPIFVPGQAAKAQASLRAGYGRNPNPSTGAIPGGTSFYLSTVGGKWTVKSDAVNNAELVSIQAPYVVDGAVSATKTATAAFSMKWVDGKWRVAGLAKSDPSKVSAGGTTFTAGC